MKVVTREIMGVMTRVKSNREGNENNAQWEQWRERNYRNKKRE